MLRMKNEFVKELKNNENFMDYLDRTLKRDEIILPCINYDFIYTDLKHGIICSLTNNIEFNTIDTNVKISKFVNIHIEFNICDGEFQDILYEFYDIKRCINKMIYAGPYKYGNFDLSYEYFYSYEYLKYKYYNIQTVKYYNIERSINVTKEYQNKIRPIINDYICDDLIGIVFEYL